MDDDVIISLSRATPKLGTLGLCCAPCRQIATGVTTKGLLALAQHCPNLSTLRIHFQVASLSVPSATPGMPPNTESTAPRTDCALTDLEVGETPMPEGSELTIARTLLRIFPRISVSWFSDEGWEQVDDAINRSKRVVDCQSKQRSLTAP